MFNKKKYLKIIAEKPDIFGNIPESILSAEKIEELRQIPRLAIGEIYGVPDIEGLMHLLSAKQPDAFLPTVSYTGTEYGSFDALGQLLKSIKKTVEKELRIYFLEPLLVGSPGFWWALNGRFMRELSDRFGFINPCFGCRLYSFALRVPLCKKLNASIIIPGDMKPDNDDSIIFTSLPAVKYYRTLMLSFGIELWYVDRNFQTGNAKKNSRNFHENPKNRILRCTFEDNYRKIDDSFENSSKLNKYFEVFALPATGRILSRTLSGADVDYVKEASDTLLPVEKAKKKKITRRA